ncbi:MAG: oligosaccharide flippase family protein [Bacteroidia bacterium]
MQKKFLTNLAFLLLLNFLIKPFYIFGIDRTVQNVVGATDYGLYYALVNFTFLFNIILDLGISNFNNRNLAQNQHLLTKHFSGIIMLRLLLAAVYFLITLSIGVFIGYGIDHLPFLLLLLLNQVIISFILYLRSNLTGLHLFRTDSIISVLDRLLMIIICGTLLWGNFTETTFKIEWFVYAQTASYSFTLIVALGIVAVKAKFHRLHWNPLFLLVVMKQSYPFALLILLMTFYSKIDSVMLERMLSNGATQAGIYAQAFRILDAVNIVAYLFAGLLLPIFARMLKLKERVDNLIKLSFTLLFVPAVTFAIVSLFYSKEIMDLLYNSHIEESSLVYSILMLSFIATCTTYIFGTLITAHGNMRKLNITAAISVVLNFGLNLLLIPRYGASGAAFASVLTQFSSAVAQVILSKYLFNLAVKLKFLLTLVGFTVGIVLITYLAKLLLDDWLLSIFIIIIFSLITAIVSGIWKVKEFYTIIKEK